MKNYEKTDSILHGNAHVIIDYTKYIYNQFE